MSDFPSLRTRLVPFRGGANSKDYNQTVSETFYDLNHLFNLVTDQENKIDEAQTLFSIQNIFHQLRMNDMQTELTALQNQLGEIQAHSGRFKAIIKLTDMRPDGTAFELERATIDTMYNVLTLPFSGEMTSKIYVYDDRVQQAFIPSSLQVTMSPAANGTTIVESDPIRAFNGDESSYWHRRYYFPPDDATMSVTTLMTVKLPDDIISNRDINMIYLNPFPLDTLTINRVEFRLNSEWKLVPGFPTDELGDAVPYTNAGYLKLHFPPVPMGELRISVTQSHPVSEVSHKVFHVGFQEIGVFYVGYQAGVGKFQFPLHLQGTAGHHKITSIRPVFANNGTLSDNTQDKSTLFTYTVYQMDEEGGLTYTRDSLPIVVSSDNIMIKASLFRDPYTQATPALQSIVVTYTDV